MAYTINLTNGAIFATIPDGTRDTSSSLVIIGKNYVGYGEFIGENFVRVLENYADTTPPAIPLTGQLWYDLNEPAGLRLYDGTTFKTIGTVISSPTEPQEKVIGDMWYDTSTLQVKVWNDTVYEIVGPLYTSATGNSGPSVETLLDVGSNEHVATVNYVEGNVVSIEHKDTPFTLNAGTPIAGFASIIYPGIHLATDVAGEVPQFTGTATNSVLLNNVNSDGYLSALNPDTTAGTLGILNDGGLTVGVDSDLQITVTGADAFINNSTPDGRIVIQANPNGFLRDVITIASTGNEARARVFDPLVGADIANLTYVAQEITTLGDAKLSLDGTTAMASTLNMNSNRLINVGDATTGTDGFGRDYADARYVNTELSSTVNTGGTTLLRVSNTAGAYGSSTAEENTLQIYQPTAGTDAFQTFHVGGDYAVHFGLDGTTNDLFVGGWSKGANKYKVWHQGNDGPGSGLNADLLDGLSSSSFVTSSDYHLYLTSRGSLTTSMSSAAGVYLYAGHRYIITASGVTHNRGTGGTTLQPTRLYNSAGTAIATIQNAVSVNWPDGNAPISGSYAFYVSVTGTHRIRFDDYYWALSYSGIRLTH